MSAGDRYVKQLNDLDVTLKRLNAKTTELRKKKKDIQTHLHAWMVKTGNEKYQGYTVAKVAPKPPAKRKPAKAKKQDALALFQQVGIDDPETFWEEFSKTQKAVAQTEQEDEEE